MITSEIREELKQIQSELKRPFKANQHEVRDIPGGQRKWAYLKWQTIRDRLEEICPDWVIDYSEIQYLGNDAICRCGITILGFRKEALASVLVSVVSAKGNEMTRGSAADRLAAEALKNAAEAWGVGRYLDDQEFTIRYLWEHMRELDEQMQGEVRRLSEQYKIQMSQSGLGVSPSRGTGASAAVASLRASPVRVSGRQTQPNKKVETGFVHALAGISNESFITEGQQKRLWAIAKTELKLSDEQIKVAQKSFGFDKTESITRDKYDLLIEHLKSLNSKSTKPAQDLYPANNEVVKQVRSLSLHDPNWIFNQCRHYGYERPGMMPASVLEKLVVDMCVDWVVSTGVVSDRTTAATSIQSAFAIANEAGQSILGAALEWLNRHAPAAASV